MRLRSRFAGLVFVALIIVAVAAASCTSSQSSSPQGTQMAGAKPYGSLKVGDSSQASANVNYLFSTHFAFWFSGVFDQLVELSPEGKMRPGIAERWEVSPDGMTDTFYIRKGVKFQNGDDLTGADVKFSMERFQSPANPRANAQWKALVSNIELKDDYTVAVHLKQPLFDPLYGIGDNQGGPAVVYPKKYIEEKGEDYFAQHPMGSGPWRVLKYQPNVVLELEALESHWRAVPKFKNLTIQFIVEEATTVAMLKTGELDLAIVSPDAVPGLRSAGVRILTHDGAAQYFMWPFYDSANPRSHAFGDVKVRKALSLAIDRKELASVLGGYAEPGIIFRARPTAYFWDSNVLKPDPFDPEGAKKLITDAGYPSGFGTTIWDTGGGGALTNLNLAVGGFWRKLGINAEVLKVDPTFVTRNFTPRRTPEAVGKVWGTIGAGDVWQFEQMRSSYHSSGGAATNNKDDPKLDELIDKVQQMRDSPEKTRAALQAAVLAKDNYFALDILDAQTLYAIGKQIGEFQPIKGSVKSLGLTYENITHAK